MRGKKKIRVFALGLALTMVFSSLSVSAYELDGNGNSIESVTYQSSNEEDFTNQTNVLAEIGSEYQVTIPKVIVLSGESKSANYNVSVDGDIAGNEAVEVIPDASVNLYSKNKDLQLGLIEQDKTSWLVSEFDITATGLIDAPGITAGRWCGTFNFNISLADAEPTMVLGDLILPPVEDWNGQTATTAIVADIGETVAIGSLVDNQSIENLEVTSSDENVLKVVGTDIEVVGAGDATITVSSNDKTYSFNVTVDEPAVTPHIELEDLDNQELVQELIDAGYINSAGDVVKLYNAKVIGNVQFPATITFDINGDYDKVAVYHHNGTNWELIATPEVIDGKITTAFNSLSPIALTKIKPSLPASGTRLANMSFAEIQMVAQSEKIKDYNINIGDKIRINETTEAQVWSIGDNYIEFITTSPVLKDVQFNDKSVTSLKYTSSYIPSNIETWLSSQSKDFSDSLMTVSRMVQTATISRDSHKRYSQTNTANVQWDTKVYLPDLNTIKRIANNSNILKNYKFWSETFDTVGYPDDSCYSNNCVYSTVIISNNGKASIATGNEKCDVVIMFRIG